LIAVLLCFPPQVASALILKGGLHGACAARHMAAVDASGIVKAVPGGCQGRTICQRQSADQKSINRFARNEVGSRLNAPAAKAREPDLHVRRLFR